MNQYCLSLMHWCHILRQYSSFGTSFNEIPLLVETWGITVEQFAMKRKYCRNIDILLEQLTVNCGTVILTKLYNIAVCACFGMSYITLSFYNSQTSVNLFKGNKTTNFIKEKKLIINCIERRNISLNNFARSNYVYLSYE